MAHGWNADPNREAMLRRVAIVLSSLPAPTAARLLNSMGDDSKRAVRRTMTTLSDVDPLERQRALHAFRVSLQQEPTQRSRPADTTAQAAAQATDFARSGHQEPLSSQKSQSLDSTPPRDAAGSIHMARVVPHSPEAMASSDAAFDGSNNSGQQSPLSFLGDVEDDMLLRLLAIEHPQAVALVLASISPGQAARLIPRLEEGLRNETLRRLGRLGEIPEAAASEVADHFRTRLSGLVDGASGNGRRALDAILAAMPAGMTSLLAPASVETASTDNRPRGGEGQSNHVTHATTAWTTAPRSERELSEKLRAAVGTSGGESETGPSYPAPSQAGVDEAVTSNRQPNPSASPHQYRTQESTASVDQAFADDAATYAGDDTTEAMIDSITGDSQQADIFASTDAIHQFLISLPAVQLCRALGKVETRDAMLALCGLPGITTEAALAILPRTKAKQVRAKMNAIESLQIRELDQAKERVAHAALRLQSSQHSTMSAAA